MVGRYKSIVMQRGEVQFPEFTGERVYMRGFYQKGGLPSDLARWQKTIDQMLDGFDIDKEIFVTLDQKLVLAGKTHRRPGRHIDGYWSDGKWKSTPGKHIADIDNPDQSWGKATFRSPEALILASDVTAALAYSGTWMGNCGDKGDCSHIDVSGLKVHMMTANNVFAGNVTMLHDSIPMPVDTPRTLVRINVPGWQPVFH